MSMKIGAMQIDTSHPLAFGEYLMNDARGRYAGVFNDSFRDDKEIEGFIKRFELEGGRFDSPDALADYCDVGFVHGCDWDDHMRCAMPFITRGKPVFIDKPLVGNIRDLNKLMELSKNGAKILGASSLRYARELRQYLDTPVEERGEIMHVYGTCGVDDFNYGIHIIEGVDELMGGKAVSARFAGRGQKGKLICDDYVITYEDGRTATYTLMSGQWQPFVITVMTSKTTQAIRVDSNQLYAALLNEILEECSGRSSLMASMDKLAQSVRIALAARISKAQGGGDVALCDIPEDDPGYDGRAFWEGYKKAAGPMYAL